MLTIYVAEWAFVLGFLFYSRRIFRRSFFVYSRHSQASLDHSREQIHCNFKKLFDEETDSPVIVDMPMPRVILTPCVLIPMYIFGDVHYVELVKILFSDQ